MLFYIILLKAFRAVDIAMTGQALNLPWALHNDFLICCPNFRGSVFTLYIGHNDVFYPMFDIKAKLGSVASTWKTVDLLFKQVDNVQRP